MISYAVNLFLFSAGRLTINKAVVLGTGSDYADPLPQALVLTAIVIGFAMTAFVVILAIRGRADLGSDHVDGYVPNASADNKEQK
jgi:multicomponent K+:H+ antiporter subunit C